MHTQVRLCIRDVYKHVWESPVGVPMFVHQLLGRGVGQL